MRRQVYACIMALAIAPGLSHAQGQPGPWDYLAPYLAQTLGANAESVSWLPNNLQPELATEAIGVAYIPFTGGNAVSISPGYFVKRPGGFEMVGPLSGLLGYMPRDAMFLPDRIELTTTMQGANDPRCCPTQITRWAIDRNTLTVRKLP